MKHKSRKIDLFLALLLLVAWSCGRDDDDFMLTGQQLQEEELIAEPIHLVLNPYGATPLAAEATVRTTEATQLELQVGLGGALVYTMEQLSVEHRLPVLGLLADHENTLIFKLIRENGDFVVDTLKLQTEPLPDYIPGVRILQHKENHTEPGYTLCALMYAKSGNMITSPFIFDSMGRIRYYLDIDALNGFYNPVKRLRNGNWVFALNETIYEYDVLGQLINSWEIDGYLQHHEVVEKADGNFLIAVSKKNAETIEDHIIELDRGSTSILNVWDLREILDNDRFNLVWNSRDWLHVNALWYDETDGGIVVSARHQGIFKVSRDNRLLWILAPNVGWGTAGIDGEGKPTSDYLLQAVNENEEAYVGQVQRGEERAPDFDWTWGQHAAMALPNGNILVFDNGFNRHFRNGLDGDHSRGVEYQINEENKTVQQVWEYITTEPGSFYSRNLGDADYLPQTGNRLFCSGNIHFNGDRYARIVEVSVPDVNVVFEAQIDFANVNATGVDIWGQTDMIYRCERLPLYAE